jgi:hypothetical protein
MANDHSGHSFVPPQKSRADKAVEALEKYLEDKSWGDDGSGQLAVVIAGIRDLAKVPVTFLDVDLLRDLADMVPTHSLHQSERDQLRDLASRLEGVL